MPIRGKGGGGGAVGGKWGKGWSGETMVCGDPFDIEAASSHQPISLGVITWIHEYILFNIKSLANPQL